MNIMLYLTVLLTVTLSSCSLSYDKLINQKEKFVWIGSDNAKSYLVTIDSVNNLQFTGKIIIDNQDTLYLSGFKKISIHPISVTQLKKDTTEPPYERFIFIGTKGYKAKAIIIHNTRDFMPQLPIRLVLYKTPKSNQNHSKKLR